MRVHSLKVGFLLSSLLEKIIPNLIGEYSSSLSIFEDLEEGWENLYIQINTNYSLEELDSIKNKLFSLIESDAILKSAMIHVIISFS